MSVPTLIRSDTATHTDTPKDKPTPIFRMKNILKFSISNLQNILTLRLQRRLWHWWYRVRGTCKEVIVIITRTAQGPHDIRRIAT